MKISAKCELNIAVAEKEKFEDGEPCLHAFLVLYKSCEDGQIEVLQQLHYDQDREDDCIVNPFVISGIVTPTSFGDVSISILETGSPNKILSLWNNALMYALEIKTTNDSGFHIYSFSDDFRHSEDAYNCRSYSIATLKNIGIETCRENFMGVAGIAAIEEEFDFPEFEQNSTDVSINSDISDLIRRNQDFLNQLAGEFIKPISGISTKIEIPSFI